jgi:DNA-binding MarR family transcriptional regulator
MHPERSASAEKQLCRLATNGKESGPMNEPMPPMPTRFRTVQLAYADMISAVQDVICGTGLTPQMALILAFVGDQIMSPVDIRRYGYFIGTSLTYSLEQLAADHLIERVEGETRRHRPIKLTPVGRRIAASIRVHLAKSAPDVSNFEKETTS